MKKIFILLLVLSCSIVVKAQSSRWKQLPLSDTATQKLYIDTTRTEFLPRFEIHKNVVIIWLKALSPNKEIEQKLAVDVATKQLEIKSILLKETGKDPVEKQVDTFEWTDIYPETRGEVLLTYCKGYLKSLPKSE